MMLSNLQSQTVSYTIDDILLEGANAYLNGIHYLDHHLSNDTKTCKWHSNRCALPLWMVMCLKWYSYS